MITTLLAGVAPVPALAQAAGCAPGATCLSVSQTGAPSAGGTFTAECGGAYPDFITPAARPAAGDPGPWFRLSQDYPATAPAADAPWLSIDYTTATGADAWLYALRDYVFLGMIEADFRPEANPLRRWYHMPMMNFGPARREHRHGLTSERTVFGPELGLKPGMRAENFAIGFYNAVGAVTIGRVLGGDVPDLTDTRFGPGTVSFKILFSAARPDDFQDAVGDLLAGAPSWTIATDDGPLDVRLMQMDVAATSPESSVGWVFGTFAYDRDAEENSPWMKLRPVGLSWGNDPGVTPADVASGTALQESRVSAASPAYAAAHLGWAGRVNGPVDNPMSGCLSCHGTAQYPMVPLFPGAACGTDAQRLQWFRNFDGSVPFGRIGASCALDPDPTGLVALDFSLQMKVVLQSLLDFHDVNPCAPQAISPANTAARLPAGLALRPADAPAPPVAERVRR
ncbi:hypothetical protein [Amaricoccus solimangrovi]|uniref:Cytochrome c domain-containing protein n=1 Tax=Amaricoccus solimangrovi TaxID=2589815 RepID=A0A501WA26_9RHOB|nr:hypothetical protein [Amaricoccus solimangrovi]TPE46783.1 hypothetical protein FJM51_21415 [Amaricoccus solimangrovi]